ncbi:alpha/beta hydrolase [Streptomyces sp. NPDC051322]|uniref:alpha/beta fold hydrolase n=1 Tax=Streptomyces sp. NPDC051322 TaxID=3154645 RepID=UPI0034508654
MSALTVNGVTLSFTDHPGPAGPPPLLLVHGWGGSGVEWREQVRAWAGRRRVVVPDLRGHGKSSVPPDGYGPRDFAADLGGLLRELGTGPVVAVGHSMGGQVTTALAVEHPGLVAALVVLDPAYGADAAEAARLPAEQAALRREGVGWAVRFVHRAFGPDSPADARARHAELMATMSPDVLLRCRDGMYLAPGAFGFRPAAVEYLAGRRCPVLAVYSTSGAADWERSTRPPAGSRTVVWTGCGHYLHEERPSELAALIDEWTRHLR